jgi:choline monooxygenase
MASLPAANLPPIEQPLEDGWTLPASWYHAPEVWEAERDRIFARSWQYAGPLEHVAEPGASFTTDVGHVPVVITRGRDGALRGFVNVCRHRGHRIAEGSGCRETLQCPYHAWTYDLDGSLRHAPRSEREPGFDPSHFPLLPVAVGTWGPFVFANPDPDAPPVAELLGELPALLATSGLDLDRIRFHRHAPWPIDVNWKIAIENYLECYHCPVAHPGFSKVIDVDPDAYQLRVYPTFLAQVAPPRAGSGHGSGYTPRGDVVEAQYHLLWPSTTINVAPGLQGMSIERWTPEGPRRVIETTDYYFEPGIDPGELEAFLDWDGKVGAEDAGLVASVQTGLESGTVPQGRLVRESERLIADFQRRVRDALTE